MDSNNVRGDQRKTILIIDDERGMLDSLEELFSESFDVLKAEGGKEGLILFGSLRVDLVLLDLRLPGMDGVEVLKSIRGLSKTVPVIVMTAHSTIERAERCADLTVQGYVRKPFDPFDLLEKVEVMLKENRGIGGSKGNRSKCSLMNRPSVPVRESIKIIGDHYTKPIRPKDVAAQVRISREYIGKKFKKETGRSMGEHINRFRIDRAKQVLLKKRNIKLSQLSNEVGFNHESYFLRMFKKYTGMTPTAFQKSVD
ncbi:MAG: response regulator [Syntrophaceae bacterium]|nr:response regulator [Syntrophaceae bacterium]